MPYQRHQPTTFHSDLRATESVFNQDEYPIREVESVSMETNADREQRLSCLETALSPTHC